VLFLRAAARKEERNSPLAAKGSMLPKTNRLTRKKDFEAVFQHGKSFKGNGLLLKIAANNLAVSRFGFVVSKKVSSKATVRNSIKRRVRAVVEKNLKAIAGGRDCIFFVAPTASNTTPHDDLVAATTALLRKARLLIPNT